MEEKKKPDYVLASPSNELEPVEEEKSVSETPTLDKTLSGSTGREHVLLRVEADKKYAIMKAWQENQKAKLENKASRKLSLIGAWENSKKVSVETKLKKYEEELERKKAEYEEKMRNKIAEIHMEAEEKRAIVEAKRDEEVLKVEETTENYQQVGRIPVRLARCFSLGPWEVMK